MILLAKKWYIKICRYVFRQKYMTIMSGVLKGYKWPTDRSYEYIIGNNEDESVLSEFCSWFKDDSVFYDLGSNIGYYSFMANTIIKNGKIYAIEPSTFNNVLFKKLVQLNSKKISQNNILLKEFAISDKEKTVSFSDDIYLAEGNAIVSEETNFTANTIQVKCYSIDELIKMNYAPPTVIKIDIEGAEYDALVGARNTLLKYKPNLLLATHNCLVPMIKEKCISFLEEIGYVIKHTGYHNKTKEGLDDYIAIYKQKI